MLQPLQGSFALHDASSELYLECVCEEGTIMIHQNGYSNTESYTNFIPIIINTVFVVNGNLHPI